MTAETLVEALERKGHAVFHNDKKGYNLNLVGIRSPARRAGRFDDDYAIMWKHKGIWHLEVFEATTDPGIHFLNRLLNPKGCAILVPGQYRGAYCLDHHRGRYVALCQRLGPVKVYRDGNKDKVLDMEPETIMEGRFGINHHHRGGEWMDKVDEIRNASAGCQVFRRQSDFYRALTLWKRASDIWGNRFTYTLIDSVDL